MYQRLIADKMPVGIVDTLEQVKVKDECREGSVVAGLFD
jgi:hypothetical protein